MAKVTDHKLLKRIALVFKELRNEMGVSQEDVYLDTNIHVGRIETGTVDLQISTIAALLKYFNIRMSDFFARVENKK